MIIDEIKTIASELSDMSPKTQLEIVKLCKNICLKMKDYIVDLDENVIAGIDARLDAIESELTVAEGNIQANANAITALQTAIAGINTTINELNAALQTLDNNKVNTSTFNTAIANINQNITSLQNQKLNVGSIILTGASGLLTSAELTSVLSNTDIIIKHNDNVFYKQHTLISEIVFVSKLNTKTITNEYTQVSQDIITINMSTGNWVFVENAIINTYNKNQMDALLNAKQNALTAGTGISITNDVISVSFAQPHLYMHKIYISESDYSTTVIIYNTTTTPFTFTTLINYLRDNGYTYADRKYPLSTPNTTEDAYTSLNGIYADTSLNRIYFNCMYVATTQESGQIRNAFGVYPDDLSFSDTIAQIF